MAAFSFMPGAWSACPFLHSLLNEPAHRFAAILGSVEMVYGVSLVRKEAMKRTLTSTMRLEGVFVHIALGVLSLLPIVGIHEITWGQIINLSLVTFGSLLLFLRCGEGLPAA